MHTLHRTYKNAMKAFIINPLFCKPTIFLLIHITIILHHLTFTIPLGRAHHLGNEIDHTALLAIKSRLIDHHAGVLRSWNYSVHYCYWDGVTCGRKHSRVVALDLNSRGLAGSISPYIGNLSFLQTISLYNNTLIGQIPPQLGNLFRLQVLQLYNNTLDGEIPANLSACANLKKLSIGRNKLIGKLPKELDSLTNLKFIGVHLNNFTGPLFDVLTNITSLEVISAGYNAFVGNIPNIISNVRRLTQLMAGGNALSGTIPTSLLNCSKLEKLSIGYNKFNGKLPSNVDLGLSNLSFLELDNNQFSGTFPNSILNLTKIEYLSLESVNLEGNVPYDFGHLRNLSLLSLGDNALHGDIKFIGTLLNCTNLQVLNLGNNNFTGVLPNSIANLSTSLRLLILENNRISGEIPVGITDLLSLEIIYLNNNELTGPIPHGLRNLKNLQLLYLGGNRLTGFIPDVFQNLSRLSRFLASDNQLQGNIPLSLGSCQSLLALDLSSNQLNGTLMDGIFKGDAKFISILLHDNVLEGSIPFDISLQVNLAEFSVSRNKLSGTIPSGLGKCLGLKFLDMHGNYLDGYIPSSFASLGSLQIIDLSRNNLSGTIPSYFSKFPLHLLNLSYNHFEGEVPTTGVFANLSAIALDGNIKLCGGTRELHLPTCAPPHKGTKKRKLKHALKLTIPIVCVLVGVLIIATCLCLTRRRKKLASISTSSPRESFIKVSYHMLAKATNGFSPDNLVGVGSFGSVFKGTLNGRVICVKVLNLQNRGASKSFIAECRALQNVRHRNLVGIITVCSSIDFQKNDFKALVYELMSNRSLDEWLHGHEEKKLTLAQRVNIAIDVAHALKYLHHDCEIPIVHRDLKPSNILLDDEMVAHVGDFGLAKFFDKPQYSNQSSSIGVLGTLGYVAPEYGLGSESSREGDIYSYGILLLELMTGKRPTDYIFNEDFNLQTYAEGSLPDNVLQIVDPTLKCNANNEEIDNIETSQTIIQRRVECIASMISVGIECSKHAPQDRMKINDAINKLQASRNSICDVTHRLQRLPQNF